MFCRYRPHGPLRFHRTPIAGHVQIWLAPDWCVNHDVADLAAQLGVHASTVYRWVAGRAVPKSAEIAIRALSGQLFIEGWEDFRMGADDGRLYPLHGAAQRRGITPAMLDHWSQVYATNRQLWQAQSRASDADDDAPSAASPLPSRHGHRARSDNPSSAAHSS